MTRSRLKIGILYDHPEDYPKIQGPDDRFAEFEPESTIVAMEKAIHELGHTPVRIGAPKRLLGELPDIDLAWNIAEGYGTRNREAWAPILCELRGIPYIGSDAHTLSLSLDKTTTKRICRDLSIPTPLWTVQKLENDFKKWTGPFPVFVKPRYEGTAKGITTKSVISDNDELQLLVSHLKNQYQQDVLVEVFLPGEEYTCAVAGNPLQALPVLQRAIHRDTKIGIHAVASSQTEEKDYLITHHLPSNLEIQLQDWSVQICDVLEVRDFARLDFKLDEAGNPYFLEINPLPTFAVDNTFAILAELQGVPYETYLSRILNEAIQRVLPKFTK